MSASSYRPREIDAFMTRVRHFRPPTLGQVMACCSLAGLLGLAYVLGAAVMHFRLPSSDFLGKAFTGGEAWSERGRPFSSFVPPGAESRREEVAVDHAEKTWDGLTLYTTTQGPQARLIDMRGKVVHRWEMPFRRAWPKPPHVHGPISEELIHWFRCHLYGNGDLLAIYHAEGDTPYGYGLIKLDKGSQLLWSYAGHAHHDLDVADDGTIYTLTQEIASKPPAGLDYLPAPYLAESIVVLSPEGKELDTIPILEAFRDSPYALLLSAVVSSPVGVAAAPPPGPPRVVALVPPLHGGTAPVLAPPPPPAASSAPSPTLTAKGDFLHVNSIKVLRPGLAPKFPLFKPGQVLISVRNLDVIAVVDLHKRSVVWAARGPWRIQHDAEFLDNGYVLLFDNGGSTKGCRVVEYDPATQALPWCYANEHSTPFTALFRGVKQGLPNRNVLIADPDGGRIFEVSAAKELVWEYFCPRSVTGAHRYRAGDLTFLKGDARARP